MVRFSIKSRKTCSLLFIKNRSQGLCRIKFASNQNFTLSYGLSFVSTQGMMQKKSVSQRNPSSANHCWELRHFHGYKENRRKGLNLIDLPVPEFNFSGFPYVGSSSQIQNRGVENVNDCREIKSLLCTQ